MSHDPFPAGTTDSLSLMTVAASNTLFAVVFGLFVVAALVLIVLTLRFVVAQAKKSRAEWLAARSGADDGDGGRREEDDEDDDDGA